MAESATLPPPLNLIYWTVPRARGREEEARKGAQKRGERRRRKWRGGWKRRDMKRDRGGEEQRERDLSEETALAGGGDAEQKKRRGGGRSGFENGGRGGDGESSPTVCRLLLACGSFAPSDWGRKKGTEAQTRPHQRCPATLGLLVSQFSHINSMTLSSSEIQKSTNLASLCLKISKMPSEKIDRIDSFSQLSPKGTAASCQKASFFHSEWISKDICQTGRLIFVAQ